MHEHIDSLLISSFYMGDSCFGINTLNIQEIIKIPDVTIVHHAPEYVIGVINLRGKIVTIIELCIKMGLPMQSFDNESRIIIARWKNEFVGLLVEKIGDVIQVEPRGLQPPPASINGIKGSYFEGVYQGPVLVGVLNTDAVLAMQEDKH